MLICYRVGIFGSRCEEQMLDIWVGQTYWLISPRTIGLGNRVRDNRCGSQPFTKIGWMAGYSGLGTPVMADLAFNVKQDHITASICI